MAEQEPAKPAPPPAPDPLDPLVRAEVERRALLAFIETGLEFPTLWEQVQKRATEEKGGAKAVRLPTHFMSGDAWNVLFFAFGRSWVKVVAAVEGRGANG